MSRDILIALLKTSGSRIQSKTLLPRLGLNDIGALAAESFVPAQDIGYLGGVPPSWNQTPVGVRAGVFGRRRLNDIFLQA